MWSVWHLPAARTWTGATGAFWYGCSVGGFCLVLASECPCATGFCIAFARAFSHGWFLWSCSERTCAHTPLLCMSKSQQSKNIRCYHRSTWRFNLIQNRSDSVSPSSVGFVVWHGEIFIFLLGWSPHGELCFHHAVRSPPRSTCTSRVFACVCAALCKYKIMHLKNSPGGPC